MRIGVPKETVRRDRRVAALPETVREYLRMGFDVSVEASAGNGAMVSDSAFADAGAQIVHDPNRLYADSDIILKVEGPCLRPGDGGHEAQMMRHGGMIVGLLHPVAPPCHKALCILCDKRATAFSMDCIPRTSRTQRMDALLSMGTIAGYKSILMAANHLPKLMHMVGTVVGVVGAARVLVVGAGVVGLRAIAAARQLGAVVTAFDARAGARKAAVSFGARAPAFDIPQHVVVGPGGQAQTLPDAWIDREREFLRPLLADADVVVLSAWVPGERAPVLVTEDMVRTMRPGSVIMDVAIADGGNCELTQPGEEVVAHGVLVSGIPNIAGLVPADASCLYARNLLEYLRILFKNGSGDIDFSDEVVQASLIVQNGRIAHAGTIRAMRATG